MVHSKMNNYMVFRDQSSLIIYHEFTVEQYMKIFYVIGDASTDMDVCILCSPYSDENSVADWRIL